MSIQEKIKQRIKEEVKNYLFEKGTHGEPPLSAEVVVKERLAEIAKLKASIKIEEEKEHQASIEK